MLLNNLATVATLASTILAAPVTNKTSDGRKMKWFGINESGPEWYDTRLPGIPGFDYQWPALSGVDTMLANGHNMVRVNFLMERLTPGSLTAKFEPAYLANLTQQINYITSKGAYAIVQPHNYGRFYGKIMTDVTGFQTWWHNVAMHFANNSLAVFDINNEFHDMPQDLVFNLNQAAINGIRGANATAQYITAEGNSFTAAYNWISSGNGASLIKLHDPFNKLIYQFHQYLDYDYSGTHEECDSPTIFRERLQAATRWLRDNKQTGLLGEYAGGNNPTCMAALKDGLQFLNDNADVWAGAVWWAAGPKWYQYMYSMDPGTPTGAQRTPGVAYTAVLPVIKPYFFY